MIKEILNKGKTQAMETKYNTQYMTIHIIVYNIQRNPVIFFLNEKNTNDQKTKFKFIEKLKKWPGNMKKFSTSLPVRKILIKKSYSFLATRLAQIKEIIKALN